VKDVADDVVVVDSFSTDETKQIVESHGARFVEHAFDGHIEQKNWAITQAKHTWVLSLDADEALDDTLVAQILQVKANPQADGYSMNRMTNYCGKWIKHGGWYPDVKLRLWNSEKGAWGGENPHDKYILHPGATAKHLKGNILHYSFYTASEHDAQIASFTEIAAKAAHAKGKHVGPLRPWIAGAAKFVRDFILRAGFLDGKTGYTIARKSALAKFLKYALLRRLNSGHG